MFALIINIRRLILAGWQDRVKYTLGLVTAFTTTNLRLFIASCLIVQTSDFRLQTAPTHQSLSLLC